MKTLLVMGDYKVTVQSGWVNLWHHDEIMQTMPARLFPKRTVDRVELVAEMIHGQERATAEFIGELERRGYEVWPID